MQPRPLGESAMRVRDYHLQGLTTRQIATLLNLSTQRVAQIKRILRDRDLLPQEEAS